MVKLFIIHTCLFFSIFSHFHQHCQASSKRENFKEYEGPEYNISATGYYDPEQDEYIMSMPHFVVPQCKNNKHTATAIFIHGLGGSGVSWSSVLPDWIRPYMRVVCPSAHKIPVTLNNGALTQAWFDRRPDHQDEDVEGINNATIYIHKLIDTEIKKGIPSERILIGGFSQGAALALHAALTYPKKLAAIIAISGYLPLPKSFSGDIIPINKKIPILQCHGDKDEIITYDRGVATATALKKVLENVDFKTYLGVKHKISQSGLIDICNFMWKYLPDK